MCPRAKPVSLQPMTHGQGGAKPSAQDEVHSGAVLPPWDQPEVRLQLRPHAYFTPFPVLPCFPLSFLMRAPPYIMCTWIHVSGSASREAKLRQWYIWEHKSHHLLSFTLCLQHVWNMRLRLTSSLKSGKCKKFDLLLANCSQVVQHNFSLTLNLNSQLTEELGWWQNWRTELWQWQSGIHLIS